MDAMTILLILSLLANGCFLGIGYILLTAQVGPRF